MAASSPVVVVPRPQKDASAVARTAMPIPALLLAAAVWASGCDALVFRAQLVPGAANIRGVRYTEGWTGDAARQNLLLTKSPPQIFTAPPDHHASRTASLNIRSHPVPPGFPHDQVTPVHFTSYQASPLPNNFGTNRPSFSEFGGGSKPLQAPDIPTTDWISPNKNNEQLDFGHPNRFLSFNQNFAFNHQLQGNVPVRQPGVNSAAQTQNHFPQTFPQQGNTHVSATNDFGHSVQPSRNLQFSVDDVSTSFGILNNYANSFNGTISNFTFAGNVLNTFKNGSVPTSSTKSVGLMTSNVENISPDPPVSSKPTEAATEVQQQNEVAKATLEDVIRHDCPNADQLGYCATPPRYPTLQIEEVYKRCLRLLRALYVPLPEEDNIKSITRANRHAWSWRDVSRESCSGVERREAPGYVRDASSGRWLVVVQTERMPQQVHVQACARRCQHTCTQHWRYAHLVTWDPDAPSLCPRLTVARLPSSCHCAAGSGV